ncbi:MAG: GNAT family N-acetyltransferase, partial [Gaiellaceae bacterium]
MHVAEKVELAGWEELWSVAPAEVAEVHGVAIAEVGGALCSAVGDLDSTMFNRVVGLGLSRPATEEDIEAVLHWFAPFGRRFYVSLSPDARRRDLSQLLERRGFRSDYAWMKFTRGVEPPPPTETALSVEVVGPDRGADFAEVVSVGYELERFTVEWLAELPRSSWRCYVAYDGDEAAGAAALFVHDGIGYLGLAATRPEHRRKGAQSALLAARIRDAAELGASRLVTETGERVPMKPSNSYRNILRYGFTEEYL